MSDIVYHVTEWMNDKTTQVFDNLDESYRAAADASMDSHSPIAIWLVQPSRDASLLGFMWKRQLFK